MTSSCCVICLVANLLCFGNLGCLCVLFCISKLSSFKSLSFQNISDYKSVLLTACLLCCPVSQNDMARIPVLLCVGWKLGWVC
ncbi:hypothetical protein BKA61DRAFT_603954 [Leptodontidium sp. MPI-SDFR-AT-0119]|nr:hypothetical protein BKA61DRAFT_603954 [Leptodontidium sp. MPI-SDFR-AT-0119]